jgi:hypothetical protein
MTTENEQKSLLQNEDFRPKIEACEKFYRRHIADIPRIKF